MRAVSEDLTLPTTVVSSSSDSQGDGRYVRVVDVAVREEVQDVP